MESKMIFENTWYYTRDHLLLTFFLLFITIAINYFMTISICPIAPGYPILIGTLGGLIGLILAFTITPESKTTNDINNAIAFVLQSL